MQLINHKKLRRQYDAAVKDGTPRRFFQELKTALESKEVKPDEFSIRQVFEEFVDHGREMIEAFRPGNPDLDVQVLEAGGAVTTADFANITNVLISQTVLDVFESPQFLFNEVCTVQPTKLNGETLAGVTKIGDETGIVGENNPYPLAGVSEDYQRTPTMKKRGVIVPVSKEALFFDQTGMVIQNAANVAEAEAQGREKRMLDEVFGITNTHNWRGTAYSTYQASTPWINIKASNGLVDWTDIENALLLFDAMTDPNTGEPINVMPDTLIVPTALLFTAKRIVGATEIRFGDGASATTQTIATNPLTGTNYRILSSPYVKARTTSATEWYVGQPKKAFFYMQNWGPTVTQAPANAEAEFSRDIVAQFKISERGTPYTFQPRRMVRNTA